MTTSTKPENTENDHGQSEFEQESENPFWSEIDSPTEMSDLNETNIEEHEKKKQKTNTIKTRKEKGIILASWNITGKNDSTHNSKWPRIARS